MLLICFISRMIRLVLAEMHYIRKLICFILLLAIHVQGFAIGRDTLYHKAYQEICAMLDGQAPLSIKRAVYLNLETVIGRCVAGEGLSYNIMLYGTAAQTHLFSWIK